MIEITHLTKKYGKHVAVDDLSLTVEKGKIYGFLGPNGAGKSTTMNIITGYLGATSGEVKINGFDILKQPEEAKKCIGYLPELPPLYMDMTAEEYLKFVAELKKLPKGERKNQIAKAMDMTGILPIKGRLIKNLSKGYKQRVGFAQAILGFPEVIILDEPTVGLDPKQMIEIRELIRKLGEEHTVILSSHILSEISEVCDHIFIISKGKLVASDATKDLTARMQGGQELTLEIKAEPEQVKNVLNQMKDAKNVRIQKINSEGICRAVLESSKDTDIREQVFYAFADAKLPIYGMSASGNSLEEIFLKLTENQSAEKQKSRMADRKNQEGPAAETGQEEREAAEAGQEERAAAEAGQPDEKSETEEPEEGGRA